MKLELRNFWKHYVNYFPILHLSFKQWEESKFKYEIDLGFFGFCLTIQFWQGVR